MSEHGELTSWPEPGKGAVAALVAGFVSGLSLQEIAAATGVSLSTVQRRRKDPLIGQAIATAQLDQRRQALGRLGAVRYQALEVLADLLEDGNPMVRLRAVNTVLTQCLRYEASANEEHGGQHRSDTDPAADEMLDAQLSDHAWQIDPMQNKVELNEVPDADEQ